MNWEYFIIYLIPSLISILSLCFITNRGTDHFAHEIIIKSIKKNHNRYLEEYPYFIGDAVMAYPQFLHWLLSFFKINKAGILGTLINLFSTISSSFLLFLFVNYFISVTDISVVIQNKSNFVILVGLAYCLFPFHYDVTNAKNTGISVRGVGLLLGQAYLYLSACFFVSENFNFLLLAIPFVVLIFFSSIFATQFVFFTTIFLAVLKRDFILFFPVLISLLFCFTFFNSYFRRYFKGQFTHKKIYSKYLADKFILSYHFSMWRDFVLDFWQILTNNKVSVVDKVKYIMSNTFVIIFLNFPFLIFFLGCFYFDKSFILEDFIFIPIEACCIVFLLTTFRKTRFLGEPQRYLEFAIGFVCIAATVFSYAFLYAYVSILVFSFLFVLVRFFFYFRKNKSINKIKQDNVFLFKNYLKEIINNEQTKVMSNSTQISKLLFDLKWKTFWHPLSQEYIEGYHFTDLFKDSYDFLSQEVVNDVIKKVEIDYYLSDISFLKHQNIITDQSFSLKLLMEDGDLKLFKVIRN